MLYKCARLAIALMVCILCVIRLCDALSLQSHRSSIPAPSPWGGSERRLYLTALEERYGLSSKRKNGKPIGTRAANEPASRGPISSKLANWRDYKGLDASAGQEDVHRVLDFDHKMKDINQRPQCKLDVRVQWKHTLERGIYATPRIESLTDYDEGTIVLPALSEDLTLLARNGHPIPGFPISVGEGVQIQASPLVFDTDGSGSRDIILVSTDAEVFIVKNSNALVERTSSKASSTDFFSKNRRRRESKEHGKDHKSGYNNRLRLQGIPIQIPKLKIPKHWRSEDKFLPLPNRQTKGVSRRPLSVDIPPYNSIIDNEDDNEEESYVSPSSLTHQSPHEEGPCLVDRKCSSREEVKENPSPSLDIDVAIRIAVSPETSLFATHVDTENPKILRGITTDNLFQSDSSGIQSESLFISRKPKPRAAMNDVNTNKVNPSTSDDVDAKLIKDNAPLENSFYEDYLENNIPYFLKPDPNHIWLDAHVHSTPAQLDIDGDGYLDLIVAVSYYFDSAQFKLNRDRFRHVPSDINPKDFSAGGLVALSLKKKAVIWSQHMDLTTMYGDGDISHLPISAELLESENQAKVRSRLPRNAQIHTSPVVADIDRDGGLDIIVATGLGYYYVFDAVDGTLKSGFPKTISHAPIISTPAIEDIDGDGDLEVVFVDGDNVLHCLRAKDASPIWRRRLDSPVARTVTFGKSSLPDNGCLDIVLATLGGGVWVLNGKTGEILPGFPIQLPGRVTSPASLLTFSTSPDAVLDDKPSTSQLENASQSMFIIVPSLNGNVYIINGSQASCVDYFDIGSPIYAAPVSGDITGRGMLDVLIATMSGDIVCLSAQGSPNVSKPSSPGLPEAALFSGSSLFSVLIDEVRGLGFRHASAKSDNITLSFKEEGNVKFPRKLFLGTYSSTHYRNRDTKNEIPGVSFEITVNIDDTRPSTQKWINFTSEHPDLASANLGSVLKHKAENISPNERGNIDTEILPPRYEIIVTREDLSGGSKGRRSERRRHIRNKKYTSETTVDSKSMYRLGSFPIIPDSSYGEVLLRKTVHLPGMHKIVLPSPRLPMTSLLTVRVVNEHHQVVKDSISISFNPGYYTLLKYIVVVPFFMLFGLFTLAPAARPTRLAKLKGQR